MKITLRKPLLVVLALVAGALSQFAQSSPPPKSEQSPVTIVAGPPVVRVEGVYSGVATGGDGTGAYVWQLGSGSTAPDAGIDPSTGVVRYSGPGTVIFHVYREGDEQ